jgi:hypothetical protein
MALKIFKSETKQSAVDDMAAPFLIFVLTSTLRPNFAFIIGFSIYIILVFCVLFGFHILQLKQVFTFKFSYRRVLAETGDLSCRTSNPVESPNPKNRE